MVPLGNATWRGRRLLLVAGLAALCGLRCTLATADEIRSPVNQRFASSKVSEQPDFRRHVIPLLGRLGCNGRACHGSFQGQGGFRLSLFGYDFAGDHAALTEGDEPRVNRKQPPASLILKKPTLTIDHEGGKRYAKGGWEYHLLEKWIASGAPNIGQDPLDAPQLEVEPVEIVLPAAGQTRALKIIARWSDGSREDVTPLCRFRTNDESVARVDATGNVTTVGGGDTHLVVFYDNAIVPVPVIVPVSRSKFPQVVTPTKIDQYVVTKLRKVAIVPAERCTDAEFLRRVSLDLTGTLPTPPEVEQFLADKSADKRAQKVDELLARPSYSGWWATRFGDLLGNSVENLPVGGEQGLNREKSTQWYDWLEARLAENIPYDQIVERIVMATSRTPGQSMEDYYAENSSYFREQDPADFAQRKTMPYFWTRGRFTPPQPLRFAYAFLGVRLECAQCHKHPYDQWTKDDFDSFQIFFTGVSFHYDHSKPVNAMKKELGLTADQDSGGYKRLFASLARKGTVVPWGEVRVPTPERQLLQVKRNAKVSGTRVFTPKVLGGEEMVNLEYDDARTPLMDWLKQPDNPYFAPALVNRVWSWYFGTGIVEPPDDMNLANPPSNGPLLAELTREFVAHQYDLKWLHRAITASNTYQASWRPNETNRNDQRNFSRAHVRRLPAEVMRDVLVQATAADTALASFQNDRSVVRARAIGVASGVPDRDTRYMLGLFGKPARDGVCDCDRSNEPSLLQTIYLRNDTELTKLIDRKDGWLAQLAKEKEWSEPRREQLIRAVYLRTFSRPPTDEEQQVAHDYLAASESPHAGLRDLLWAMLNSKEFLLNH